MTNSIFKGSSLEKCLQEASNTLKISENDMEYVILEEKKGLFKKSVTISARGKTDTVFHISEKDGKVEIKNGKITVKNPKETGKPAIIIPDKEMKIMIDGEESKTELKVYEESHIEVYLNKIDSQRYLDLNTSPDNMKLFISIKYIPETIYKLKDKIENNCLTLECEEKETNYPPLFSLDEIYGELEKIGAKYGIIEENLRNAIVSKEGCRELLIAEGLCPKDDTDDVLELKFTKEKLLENIEESRNGRIDYRNICSITSVEKGAIIAVKHEGVPGHDGRDIYGNIVKKRSGKLFKLSAGKGCILKDENIVESIIEGKPCIKNNTFHVFPIHEIHENVDMKSGNIKFIGDVKVFGNVKEGMTVEAGNTIEIIGSVDKSRVSAEGNITIKDNIIMSTVTAGGQDALVIAYINELNALKQMINDLIKAIIEIKRFNLLGNNVSDGNTINALIGSKFKKLRSLCMSIILRSKKLNLLSENKVAELLREKLMGLSPLGIKHFSELDTVIEAVSEELDKFQCMKFMPVDTVIGYCQDSNIESSGSIYIIGKGEYVSNLTAQEGIYFTYDNSVARGGTIKAETEINCKTVGTPGGVASTHLIVGQKGQIYISKAYENTIITVGHKEFIIEEPSRNIRAYLDHKSELVVDKIK